MNRVATSTALFALATALAAPAMAQDSSAQPQAVSTQTDAAPARQTLRERRLDLKRKRAEARQERRQATLAKRQAQRRDAIAKGGDGRRRGRVPRQAQPAVVEGDSRDDIIVTALLRDQTSANAASSTSVVTGDTIADLGGIGDQGDLVDLLPGVNFADNGGVNSEISIRGAGGETSQSNDTDSAVAILRNGARVTGGNLSGKSFSRMDSFDLGQAEVVRGPEGALYGANAVGGVINLVSQKPKFRNGASFDVSYRPEVNEVVQNAILNLAPSNTLAFRFGYQGDKREGGFFLNQFNKSFGDSSNDQLGRASVLFKPSKAFSDTLVLDYEFQRTPPGPVKTLGATDIDGPFIYGHNTFDSARKRELSVNNNLEWNTGIGKITSITAYRWRDTSVLTDSDNSYPGYTPAPTPAQICPTGLCTRSDNDKTSIVSEELRLDIKGSRRFDMIVGGNIQFQDTKSFTLSDGRTISTTNLGPNTTRNNSLVSNRSETQIGLFASMEWKPLRGLTIDGAARYNRSEKSAEAYTVQRSPATVPSGTLCPYTDPQGISNPATDPCAVSQRSFDTTFENVSPSLSIKYLIAPRWSVYGSVARGYRPGGFNPTSASDPTVPPTYDGETTTAYELGTKWRWRKMLLSLAGFYNHYDNLLVIGFPPSSTGDPDDPTAYYRFNAGTAENYGFDSELSGDVPIPRSLGRLKLTAALNYVHGRITSGPYDGQNYEGSPDWTSTFSAIWSKDLTDAWKITGSGSFRGEHGGFAKTSQTLNTILYPPKDILKLRLALESRALRFEVAADNVLNNVYPTRVTSRSSIYADPRIITFKVGYALGGEQRRRR